MTSVIYRQRAFSSSTIADLAESLTLVDALIATLRPDPSASTAVSDADSMTTTALAATSVLADLEEFHHNLGIVIEGLSQNAAVLLAQHAVVVSHLLPALLGELGADNGDVRLACLRAFIDIITHYITKPELYDPTLTHPSLPATTTNMNRLSLSSSGGSTNNNVNVNTNNTNTSTNTNNSEECRSSTKRINDLIEKLLLPRYAKILNDADPIPMYPYVMYYHIIYLST